VGFPGETEDAFQRLLDFAEEARFDRLGAFAFSPEEDTLAAEMPDQVPEEIKAERLDRLMRLQQKISLQNNQARVGETCEALIERQQGDRWIARSRREAPEGDGSLILRAGKRDAEDSVPYDSVPYDSVPYDSVPYNSVPYNNDNNNNNNAERPVAPGQYVTARITGADPYDLTGEIL